MLQDGIRQGGSERRARPSTKPDSPGVEEEPTGEGDNEEDDGEVELELLVLIFICKPAGKHKDRLGASGGCWKFVSSHPTWIKARFCGEPLGHAQEKPCLGGISERTRLLPHSSDTSGHPKPPQTWRVPLPGGGDGQTGICSGLQGEDWATEGEGTQAPGWAPLAQERLSWAKPNFWCFPKGIIHCLSFLEVPNTVETRTWLRWRMPLTCQS